MMYNMIECKTHGQQIDVVCKKCYETLQRELEEVKIDRQAWKDNCDDMGEAIRDLRKDAQDLRKDLHIVKGMREKIFNLLK